MLIKFVSKHLKLSKYFNSNCLDLFRNINFSTFQIFLHSKIKNNGYVSLLYFFGTKSLSGIFLTFSLNESNFIAFF